jgi:hypothetical protein
VSSDRFFFSFPFLSIFYFSRCQFTWAAVKSTTVIRQPLSRNRFCTHKSTIFKKRKQKTKLIHIFLFFVPLCKGSLSLPHPTPPDIHYTDCETPGRRQ